MVLAFGIEIGILELFAIQAYILPFFMAAQVILIIAIGECLSKARNLD